MTDGNNDHAEAKIPPIPNHIIIKHESDTIEVSNNICGGSDTNIPHTLPLVDEIDLEQTLIFSSKSKPWQASSIQGVVIGKEQLEVICKASTIDGGDIETALSSPDHNSRNRPKACPCCRRYIQRANNVGGYAVDNGDDVTLTPPPSPDRSEQHIDQAYDIAAAAASCENPSTTLSSLVQAATSIMQPMASPPLVAGDQLQEYTITQTIVQGWLYKKGTGDDFSGRRWWKPRWVTLALAESSNTIIPTPILLSHRAPGVPYPASIIELTKSTVIMAIERTRVNSNTKSIKKKMKEQQDKQQQQLDTPEWNRHCFQIVHTHHLKDNSTTSNKNTTTRIFTAPIEDRNEWVFALNNALLDHEKRSSKARSDAAKKNECLELTRHQTKRKSKTNLKVRRVSLLDCEDDDDEDEEPQLPTLSLPPTHPGRFRPSSSESYIGTIIG